jgi:hypothetical protein
MTTMSDVARAGLALFLLAGIAIVIGMAYFRCYALIRPPLGVMTLGDVAFMVGAIILIPYLYLSLPGWLVATLLGTGSLGLLQLLFEPLLRPAWLSWLVAATLVAIDLALAHQVGTSTIAEVAVNNVVLLLTVVAVTNVWAQSGLRARDLAILAAALVLYDLIATSLLPLTTELVERLAGLPFTPVLAWPVGDQGWSGLGLGDLLFATVGPLVFRKAFGRTAGWVAIGLALIALGGVMLAGVTGWLPGIFPVMVVLGPLLVTQYLIWIRVRGSERTTAHYLADEPPRLGPATSQGC